METSKGFRPIKIFFAVLTSILFIGSAVYYAHLTEIGGVKPLFSSWLFFSTAMGLAALSYSKIPQKNWLSNIGTGTGLLSIWLVFFYITTFGRDNLIISFSFFNLFCFGLVAIVFFSWLILKNHFFTNYASQCIMVIGYLPLYYYYLFEATQNTESYILWGSVLLGNAFAFIPGILGKDKPAIYNSIRGMVTSGILLVLMMRLDYF